MLRRLFGRGVAPGLLAPSVDARWAQSDWRAWEPPANLVVGESHHGDSFVALAGSPRQSGYLVPVAVEFVREPDNPYDDNAIRVQVDGRPVGHVQRAVAAVLSISLDTAACKSFTLAGLIRGGSMSAPNFGVQVWLDRRLTPAPSFSRAPVSFASWPPAEDAAWVEPPRGRPPSDPVDRYEWLIERIEAMWQRSRYRDVLPLCIESLELLPAVLRDDPDIIDVPALSYAGSLMAALGDAVALEELRERFVADSMLARWVPEIEDALRDATVTDAILALAAQRPNILQKDLPPLLGGASKERIRRACYWAAAVGRLDRQKAGVSYSLGVSASVVASIKRDAVDVAIGLFLERPDREYESPTIENPTPLDELLQPVDARLHLDRAPAPYEDPDGYDQWRRRFDDVSGLTVERNLRGIRAEKEDDLQSAIAMYEANVRDGFEGNHPYDRLAILYRKQKRVDDEVRVLERAIEVFSSLSPARSDVAPKLTKFRARLEKAQRLAQED
jgi:tetratricopeptide (TPR) repeat protein